MFLIIESFIQSNLIFIAKKFRTVLSLQTKMFLKILPNFIQDK